MPLSTRVLLSVRGDPNSHQMGMTYTAHQNKVFIQGKQISLKDEQAVPDGKCRPKKPPVHCNSYTVELTTANIYVTNFKPHFVGARRACGATAEEGSFIGQPGLEGYTARRCFIPRG